MSDRNSSNNSPKYEQIDHEQHNSRNRYFRQQQDEENQQAHYNQDVEHHNYEQTTYQSQIPLENQKKISEDYINHKEIGHYANTDFQADFQSQDIKISITKTQTRGNMLAKYTVYFIEGTDPNGQFAVARRFKQFDQMRMALVSRWPGCFIPSIPTKNLLKKNQADVIQRRRRYLNDFVKKVAKLPHIYNSQQFQALIRSKQTDISSLFSKWSAPSVDSIINKYRECFAQLAGKEINSEINNQINQFILFLKKNQKNLERDRTTMRNLAQSRDRLDSHYSSLFTKIFPNYEKYCLSEYVQGNQQKLLYLNSQEAKLAQHQNIIKEVFTRNPYWLLFDMFRHQQRDGLAFLQALQARQKYQNKSHNAQNKIIQNQKAIAQISMGKKNFVAITSKGTNDQIKYKLGSQNQDLKKEKQNILILCDIITALIAYVEIERYKKQKADFYNKAMKKIGGYEINLVQNLGQIWAGTKKACDNVLSILHKEQSIQ